MAKPDDTIRHADRHPAPRPALLKIHTRVTVDDHLNGTIRAYVTADLRGDDVETFALVELDYGFYSEDRKTFLRVITAHVDNLKRRED